MFLTVSLALLLTDVHQKLLPAAVAQDGANDGNVT